MLDIRHLIKTKQFFAAAGKLVLREGAKDGETVEKVSGIAREAIKTNCTGDLRKIIIRAVRARICRSKRKLACCTY